MGKVTSGFLRVQSRTARARFQGIQFAHDNLPNDRCLLACNDEIEYFTIDTADEHKYLSIKCCVASACFHTFTSEEPMRKA